MLPAGGTGALALYRWDISSVAGNAAMPASGRIRIVNRSNNGKKVFVSYSVIGASM